MIDSLRMEAHAWGWNGAVTPSPSVRVLCGRCEHFLGRHENWGSHDELCGPLSAMRHWSALSASSVEAYGRHERKPVLMNGASA